MCPGKQAGAVIGKAGATIAQLRKDTGANIGVEQSEDKRAPRRVTISGSHSQVQDAVR
eukprot:CAMPEP_0195106118 /NCGR_PEP_ID=MMETSP0448-20130528/79306_1 /TAXON_ID=66468 /ORGANISM="Heterocapsa triquestra, Strain CCMP 448" /LENGTH=57 /DNA_ID=CAMNT_0040142289 /DNA_START=69 /DNA_END=238 /DNA_ORIENTATION=+